MYQESPTGAEKDEGAKSGDLILLFPYLHDHSLTQIQIIAKSLKS